MGTRNLICVVKDNEYKVAKYCQWDGYPEGQGAEILDFLQSGLVSLLRHAVDKVQFIDDDELHKLWVECGADDSGWVNTEIADRFKEKYLHLSRDTGASILNYIVSTKDDVIYQTNSIEFAADSLFCEWAYVIDLDNNTFEIYEGFNKDEPKGRFKDMQPEDTEDADNAYKPITLVKSYSLIDLPSRSTFISDLTKEDEEYEVTEDAVLTVLEDLKAADETPIVDHIVNYISANMDDFLESINPED